MSQNPTGGTQISNYKRPPLDKPSDIMILAETWILEGNDGVYQENDFKCHLNKYGRGKGLAVYHKEDLQEISDLNVSSFIFTKLVTEELNIFAIY